MSDSSKLFVLLLYLGFFVQTSLFLLMDNEVLDVLYESLQVFISVIFFLESLDASTVRENGQELEHGLIRLIEELLDVRSGRILIYVHCSKLEIFFSKLSG